MVVLICGCSSSPESQTEETMDEYVEEYNYDSETIDTNDIDKIKK